MNIIPVSPNNFNEKFAISLFKAYVKEKHKHPWHTLGNAELWEALDEFNAKPENSKMQVKKFWD